jgi:nicotinate dehydrogenase subunit B
MQVWNVSANHEGDSARLSNDFRGEQVSENLNRTMFPRRDLLKAGGALIVGCVLGRASAAQLLPASGTAATGAPDPKLLNTWIAIHSDNTATIFFGFVELGQGNSTALLQVAAEELDFDMGQIKSVPIETGVTPNQGGTVASASINKGGPQIRAAAAEARLALLALASKHLNAPVERLTVSKGIVSVEGSAKESVTYGELVGNAPFDVPVTGTAPLKRFAEYKVVATRIQRRDIPDKVSGKWTFVQHIRLPGMLNGRIVRPRGQGAYGAGARIVSIDQNSIQHIPNAQVVRRRDFVGVTAPVEWDAIRAAQELKVTWEDTPTLAGHIGLHEQMRASETIDEVVTENTGMGAALSQAAHVVSQTYRGPYQSHAPFGPNCAVAHVTKDSALIMCSSQSVYDTRATLATVLGMPVSQIRVQFHEGSGTYGHSCYDDVTQAAAIMSQELDRPVRVQFMRWDEHGWDNYGPAHFAEVRAGIDANGKIMAYEYQAWQHTWSITETSQQLTGTAARETSGGRAQNLTPLNSGSMYDIPNVRRVNHRVPGINGFLKGSYLRSPLDISISFASEQTIDELAYLAGMDPHAFRQRNISDVRWLEVLNAVARAAHWTPARAAAKLSTAKVVTGRGIAVGTHLSSYAAAVAEIEVNKETGQIVAKHMYGALDAGQAVNPGFVENQISGMLIQATSRILKEEVTFTKTRVTSLDWDSYPILRFAEHPEVTSIVVQRLDQPSTGAGEEVLGPAAAAIANAFFDATGVRLRQYPLTPSRVQAALQS